MTSLTSSIQVSEEVIAAGAAAFQEAHEQRFPFEVRLRMAYLAMKAAEPLPQGDVERALVAWREMVRSGPSIGGQHLVVTVEAANKLHAAVAAITAIGSQSIAPDETEMCDACDGSGFGVADTYCGKCGGAGCYPLAKDEERHA